MTERTTDQAGVRAAAPPPATNALGPAYEPVRARLPLVVGVWAIPGLGDEAVEALDRVVRSLEDADLDLLLLTNEAGEAASCAVAARAAQRKRRADVAVVQLADVAAAAETSAAAPPDGPRVWRLAFPAAPEARGAPLGGRVRRGGAACFIALRSMVRVVLGAPPPQPGRADLDALGSLDTPEGLAAFFAACAECGRVAAAEGLAGQFYRLPEPWRPARRRLDPPEIGCNSWRCDPVDDDHLAAIRHEFIAFNRTIPTEGCASWAERLLSRADPSIAPAKGAANLFPPGDSAHAAPAPNLLAAYLASNVMTKRLEGIRDRAMALIYGSRGPRTTRPFLLPVSRLLCAMGSLSFAAVLLFAAYSKLYKEHAAQTLLLSLYVLLLVAVSTLMAWLMRADLKRRSEDLRALREGLRIQMMWRLAGVDSFAADHYPRTLKEEVAWIRAAIGAAAMRALVEGGPARAPDDRDGLVLRVWLEEQTRFYGTGGHGASTAVARAPHPAPKMARTTEAVLDAETRHGLTLGLVVGATLLTLIHLGTERVVAWTHGHGGEATHLADGSSAPPPETDLLGGGILELSSTALGTAILIFFLWAYQLYLGLPGPANDHEGAAGRRSKRRRWDRVAVRALATGLIAALAFGSVAVWLGMLLPETRILVSGQEFVAKWLVTSITVAALLAGLIHTRLHLENDINNAHSYEAAGAIYREACRAYTSLLGGAAPGEPLPPDLEAARRKLLKEVGRQALAESGRWLLQRRERDLELPHTV